MLAYLFDPEEPELARERELVRDDRVPRAQGMVAKLRELGVPITWEQVARIAGDGAVGRPHIATALVELGVVGTVSDAFTPQWLANDGRAYVEKHELDPFDAIRLVKAAGGVTVFAHPLAVKRGYCRTGERDRRTGRGRPRRHRGRPHGPRRADPGPAARRWPPTSACWPPAPATTTAAARPAGSANTPPTRRSTARSCAVRPAPSPFPARAADPARPPAARAPPPRCAPARCRPHRRVRPAPVVAANPPLRSVRAAPVRRPCALVPYHLSARPSPCSTSLSSVRSLSPFS